MTLAKEHLALLEERDVLLAKLQAHDTATWNAGYAAGLQTAHLRQLTAEYPKSYLKESKC